MPTIYEHQYERVSVYGNVVSLLQVEVSRAGVHLDLGCGYGPIAEPLRDELSLTYIGFDLAEDGLASLRGRGFETYRIDLAELSHVETILQKAIDNRPVASITLLDTLEHITNGEQLLRLLRRFAEPTDAPFVISVPNVTHKDVALKLLSGRWDVTEAGLLDYTHVTLYSHARLSCLMTTVGWRETKIRDWLLQHSDQHFPAASPLLNDHLPIGHFLLGLITQANPHAIVNQFVRLYRVDQPDLQPLLVDRAERAAPFLSIIWIIAAGSIAHVSRISNQLANQTNHDFELLIVDVREQSNDKTKNEPLADLPLSLRARTRLIHSNNNPARADVFNAAVAQCTGRYFSILDDADEIDPNWVAVLATASEDAPGAVLQLNRPPSTAASDTYVGVPSAMETELSPVPPLYRFARAEHGPFATLAIPSAVFHQLGIRFSLELPDGVGWDLAIEAILHCSIHIVTPSHTLQCSVSDIALKSSNLFDVDHISLLSKLNGRPILLPVGTAELVNRLVDADADNHALRQWQDKLNTDIEILRARGNILNQIANTLATRPLLFDMFHHYFPKLARKLTPSRQTISSDSPFLSVITRTRGIRPHTLRDTLMSLAGQSCQDFELIIVIYGNDTAILEAIRQFVAEFPFSLRQRIRVITCNRLGRASPLNEGIRHSKGDYIVVLDDDDIVFAHWVETFKNVALQSPGRLVRARCVRQEFELTAVEEMPAPRAVSWFLLTWWPPVYDAIAHLHSNYTPNMSIAYPASIFREDGLTFDENLETTEDWDLTTRAAMLRDVASTPEVTAIHRWWLNGESSLFTDARDMADANVKRVREKFNSQPILLPAGSASRIVSLREGIEELHKEAASRDGRIEKLQKEVAGRDGRIEELQKEVAGRHDRIEKLQKEVARRDDRIEQLVNSTLWRATAPVRGALRLLKPAHVQLVRRGVKLMYWILTPHRIPQRLRFIRQRER